MDLFATLAARLEASTPSRVPPGCTLEDLTAGRVDVSLEDASATQDEFYEPIIRKLDATGAWRRSPAEYLALMQMLLCSHQHATRGAAHLRRCVELAESVPAPLRAACALLAVGVRVAALAQLGDVLLERHGDAPAAQRAFERAEAAATAPAALAAAAGVRDPNFSPADRVRLLATAQVGLARALLRQGAHGELVLRPALAARDLLTPYGLATTGSDADNDLALGAELAAAQALEGSGRAVEAAQDLNAFLSIAYEKLPPRAHYTLNELHGARDAIVLRGAGALARGDPLMRAMLNATLGALAGARERLAHFERAFCALSSPRHAAAGLVRAGHAARLDVARALLDEGGGGGGGARDAREALVHVDAARALRLGALDALAPQPRLDETQLRALALERAGGRGAEAAAERAAAAELQRQCALCARCKAPRCADGAALLRCATCLAVAYCSTGCQREDWRPRHKGECATLAAARADA